MDVTVVGAGVIGLTTGVLLQEAGTNTRILTDRPVATTTSTAAGGIWYPYNAPDDPDVEAWMRDTLVELTALADEEPNLVRRCETRQYFYEPEADPYWSTMPDLFRHATPSELPAGRTHGWVFSSVIIDTPHYLDWLQKRFEKAGGEVQQKGVASLDDLNGLIMNCAGVGAHQIASDPTVYPIRGQVIRIANPGLEFATLDDENPAGLTYILPRFDDCILGGSSDADDWNLETDAELTRAILRRCAEVEPRVAGAQVLDVRVGLRPGRPSIRVEREDRPNAVVVHNYGHAGNGFSTSWATARHAVRLLRA